MKFGEKVRAARIALNLSQIELGEKVGVTERSIYSYEQTGIFPRKAVLLRLAGALNVSVGYLMDEEAGSTPSNFDQELFFANAKNQYGAKGAREASEVLKRAATLFAGGELEDSAKDIFFKSIAEVYLESKAEAREKFTSRRRKSRKA